jgi:tRNA pseudouridine(55) synthase
MESLGIETLFNGPESFTPDDNFQIGESPELGNFYVAAGFNAIGIQAAGGAGKYLAEWIVGKEPPCDLWDVDIRRNQSFQSNKTYLAEVTLGQQTDTDDAEGEITSTHQVICHEQEVEEKLLSFLGESKQLAPAYSALKHKGKPMYKYAREGIHVDKEARIITIDGITNISINLPKVSFSIACSKGTYIRSIARDLGNQLECGGHLSRLIRTSQEKFTINSAISIDEAREEDIIPLENAFDNLNTITLNQLDTNAFINGVPLKLKIDHSDLLRVYDPSKKFIAIGKNTLQGFKHEYLV